MDLAGWGGVEFEVLDSTPSPKSTDLTVSKFSGLRFHSGWWDSQEGESITLQHNVRNDLGVPLNSEGRLFLRGRKLERQAVLALLYIAEVKNAWRFTSS